MEQHSVIGIARRRSHAEMHPNMHQLPDGLKILAPVSPDQQQILSPDALPFFAELQRGFNPRRLDLLAERKRRQHALDHGENPSFLKETESIRAGSWRVAGV